MENSPRKDFIHRKFSALVEAKFQAVMTKINFKISAQWRRVKLRPDATVSSYTLSDAFSLPWELNFTEI